MSNQKRGPAAPGESPLVGVAEVASRLGVTAERVRQLSKAGRMPDPVGRLGRQLVWQWPDIESWARDEGRLPSSGDEGRQPVRSPRGRPPGALRMVVDEVMSWGRGTQSACHVRVWAPPLGSPEPHVVLLGQLDDLTGGSVTNEIEMVAMTAAMRYLGSGWRRAQFYQYRPASPLDDADEFLHVTFTVKAGSRSSRWTRGSRVDTEPLKSLDGRLVEPSWRRTRRDEIEGLTGDTLQVWMPGTYTKALLATAAERRGERLELTWDPEHSRDLAELAALLLPLDSDELCRGTAQLLGVDVHLTQKQIEAARILVAHAALAAKERAEQDARTQPADVAIWPNPPVLTDEAALFSATARSPLEEIEPADIWELVAKIRGAIVASTDPALASQRQLLVPGRHGGWVTLAWYDANVQEPIPENAGWYGPVATPTDLTDAVSPTRRLGTAEQLLLLTDALAGYLEDHWPRYREHDVPAFRPSTTLPARGPITRTYLGGVNWQSEDSFDPCRLNRLRGVIKIGRVGVDPDGWLVAVSPDGNEFACEWPVSGDPDVTLSEATIRADRPGAPRPTPVYVQRPDGRLQLLPASRNRHQGNSYTWGYSGTGPSNLAAATLDLLHRATPERVTPDAAWTQRLLDLVASPRVPDWHVADLLRRTSKDVSGDPARLSERWAGEPWTMG